MLFEAIGAGLAVIGGAVAGVQIAIYFDAPRHIRDAHAGERVLMAKIFAMGAVSALGWRLATSAVHKTLLE